MSLSIKKTGKNYYNIIASNLTAIRLHRNKATYIPKKYIKSTKYLITLYLNNILDSIYELNTIYSNKLQLLETVEALYGGREDTPFLIKEEIEEHPLKEKSLIKKQYDEIDTVLLFLIDKVKEFKEIDVELYKYIYDVLRTQIIPDLNSKELVYISSKSHLSINIYNTKFEFLTYISKYNLNHIKDPSNIFDDLMRTVMVDTLLELKEELGKSKYDPFIKLYLEKIYKKTPKYKTIAGKN